MTVLSRKKRQVRNVKIDMTPMIDVVFQLLIFFVMTFKIVAPEGDFSIKMPPAGAASSANLDMPPEPLRVKLSAGPGGSLSTISLGDKVLGRNFVDLRRRVFSMIQQRGGPDKADVEIELAPDNTLQYTYVIEAITAVSGEAKDGRIYKICDKIKFAPRRSGG